LVNAPEKFAFAENNIQLVIKIYDEPVAVQTYTQGDQSYSYSLAAGEMKMDLIINNWTWNFSPKTVQLLNSTDIGITPALALQIDASVYNVSSVIASSLLGNDISNITAPVAQPNVIYNQDGATTSISLTGQNPDANQLKCTTSAVSENIAGKRLDIVSPAKLTLNSESTLEGFLKFVPFAIVNNSGTYSTVNVGASYLENGNHLRLYITYPYFNGTLTHDPSIGVQSSNSANNQNPAYIITQGLVGTTVQQLPAITNYPTLGGAGIAAGIVLVGAAILILILRRHPTVG
jgi:hypothetical protein